MEDGRWKLSVSGQQVWIKQTTHPQGGQTAKEATYHLQCNQMPTDGFNLTHNLARYFPDYRVRKDGAWQPDLIRSPAIGGGGCFSQGSYLGEAARGNASYSRAALWAYPRNCIGKNNQGVSMVSCSLTPLVAGAIFISIEEEERSWEDTRNQTSEQYQTKFH